MSQHKLGRYSLDRRIAIGGMAEIWLARQDGPAGFQKTIVIKRILRSLIDDKRFVEMFLDEARLVAQLNHPNIVQIFDLGEADGEYFIAMEFIDGYSLASVMERAANLGTLIPPAIAARILADACSGLDFAHSFRMPDGTSAGIVHRDVSPQNILISKDGVVKIVDFGVAKANAAEHKTQTGAVKGKLSYMSPEQISAMPLDARSDVFALGIVLYEVVTGRRPFGHDSELLAITAILNEQPQLPREFCEELPEAFEAIILKALEKDVGARYQSAGAMMKALEQEVRSHDGAISTRDVAEYLTDLFSDAPTLSVPAIASSVSLARTAGVPTRVGHPSRDTRSQQTTGSNPATVPLGPNTLAGLQVEPSNTRRSLFAIAAVIVVALLAAFGAWKVLSLDSTSAPSPATGHSPAVAAAVAPASTSNNAVAARAAATDAAQPTATSGGPTAQSPPSAPTVVEIPADPVVAPTSASAAAGALNSSNAPFPPDGTTVAPTAVTAGPEANSADGADGEPRSRSGEIQFLSPGGAHDLYIDGEKVGKLPGRNVFDVSPGRHSVRTIDTAGRRFETTVTVESGERERVNIVIR